MSLRGMLCPPDSSSSPPSSRSAKAAPALSTGAGLHGHKYAIDAGHGEMPPVPAETQVQGAFFLPAGGASMP